MHKITTNISDFINHNDLTALQTLAQLSQNTTSDLTELIACASSVLNSSSLLDVDPYSNFNSVYSSLAVRYSSYQELSDLTRRL
ncbi:unnamed protein product [Rotaria sordida]|uniref:Uncharacterized protein n=2 Tax=Rotaria sordida TaxID=392033 RepID=A0A814XCH4_9BILA|nr:unnamed protein product [Rotaria sordida]